MTATPNYFSTHSQVTEVFEGTNIGVVMADSEMEVMVNPNGVQLIREEGDRRRNHGF